MPPPDETRRVRWIVAAYAYSFLHIGSWRVFLEGNGQDLWLWPFGLFFAVFFLPLNVVAGGLCLAAWGTFNLFEARYVLGMVWDVAVASLLSTTVAVGVALAWERLRTTSGAEARRPRRRQDPW